MLELFVVPGLAVLLPWPLAFEGLKWLARSGFLYRDTVDRAYREAQRLGHANDELDWKTERRLVTLVDHADLFLSLTRSKRWLKRHVEVTGHWPTADQPALLCTFHWGAGMWVLRHMRAAQLNVHALVAPLDGAHFKGRRVLQYYAKLRTHRVAKELGRHFLDTSDSLRPAFQALRQQEQLLAVVDVPADQAGTSQPITLLNRAARVPRPLFRMAVEKQVPVTVFLVGLNTKTGRRYLDIVPLGTATSVDGLADAVFRHLNQALTRQPAAWHFWSEAPRLFTPPPLSEPPACTPAR